MAMTKLYTEPDRFLIGLNSGEASRFVRLVVFAMECITDDDEVTPDLSDMWEIAQTMNFIWYCQYGCNICEEIVDYSGLEEPGDAYYPDEEPDGTA